jgi:hypothetical protein
MGESDRLENAMIIREEPVFNFNEGRRARVFSKDSGETWCVELCYLPNRKPRCAGVDPTLRNLTKDDAMKRAKAWIAGSYLASVRMGVMA